MRLLGDGPIVDATKNGQKVPKLENVRNVLVICNLVQNTYLQESKLLFSFAPNSKFGSLLSITLQELKYCETIDSIFDYVEVLFTDENNRPLQIDDHVTISISITNQYA